ncbi:MAG: serine hydrolase, partial [Gemmatimonadota bacterium]
MNPPVRQLTLARNGGIAAISLLVAAGCGGDSMNDLRALLTSRIEQTPADVVSVYFYDLATGDSLEIEADTVLHAASMMKVLVMIQAFRDVDANLLSLNDEIAITNTFHSVIDGSPFRLAAGDDSDSTLYARLGKTARIAELVDLMIAVSSNLATNILI